MKKFKIAFFVRDQDYLDDIEELVQKTKDKIQNIEFFFISNSQLKSKHSNINLNKYIKNIEINLTKEEYLSQLNNEIWKNKEVYTADPRYVSKPNSLSWKDQYKVHRASQEIFNEFNFDIIFSGGAAYTFWTVPHLVALEKNLLAYKLMFYDYINPYFKGVRVWFSTDPFWDITVNNNFDFKWNKKDADKQIQDFRKSLLEDNFNLADTAIKLREDFTPKKLKNILKNILKLILKFDRLSFLRLKSSYFSSRNKKYYTNIDHLKKPFFLYPLNQPYDEQLLLRAPNFTDNINTIKFLMKNLPNNIDLVIKEHPVNPGMISSRQIKYFINTYKNIKFISPESHLRDVLKISNGMITINSTSGLEALVLNKNILVLGEGYYKSLNSTFTLDEFTNQKEVFESLFTEKKVDTVEVDKMLRKLLDQTYPSPGIYPDRLTESYSTLSDAIYYKIKNIIDLKGEL